MSTHQAALFFHTTATLHKLGVFFLSLSFPFLRFLLKLKRRLYVYMRLLVSFVSRETGDVSRLPFIFTWFHSCPGENLELITRLLFWYFFSCGFLSTLLHIQSDLIIGSLRIGSLRYIVCTVTIKTNEMQREEKRRV